MFPIIVAWGLSERIESANFVGIVGFSSYRFSVIANKEISILHFYTIPLNEDTIMEIPQLANRFKKKSWRLMWVRKGVVATRGAQLVCTAYDDSHCDKFCGLQSIKK